MSRLQQSVLQLLASAVLLVVVYIVATPTSSSGLASKTLNQNF